MKLYKDDVDHPFWQGFWYGLGHIWVMPWSKTARVWRAKQAAKALQRFHERNGVQRPRGT